jgi:hypothetical protein
MSDERTIEELPPGTNICSNGKMIATDISRTEICWDDINWTPKLEVRSDPEIPEAADSAEEPASDRRSDNRDASDNWNTRLKKLSPSSR